MIKADVEGCACLFPFVFEVDDGGGVDLVVEGSECSEDSGLLWLLFFFFVIFADALRLLMMQNITYKQFMFGRNLLKFESFSYKSLRSVVLPVPTPDPNARIKRSFRVSFLACILPCRVLHSMAFQQYS